MSQKIITFINYKIFVDFNFIIHMNFLIGCLLIQYFLCELFVLFIGNCKKEQNSINLYRTFLKLRYLFFWWELGLVFLINDFCVKIVLIIWSVIESPFEVQNIIFGSLCSTLAVYSNCYPSSNHICRGLNTNFITSLSLRKCFSSHVISSLSSLVSRDYVYGVRWSNTLRIL